MQNFVNNTIDEFDKKIFTLRFESVKLKNILSVKIVALMMFLEPTLDNCTLE